MTPDFASLDKNGCNCLHFAAYHNYENTDILESLLSHNTCHIEHINKKAFDGLTPLDYAIQFNSFPTQQSFIDVLRKHGAKTSVEIDGNNSSANDFKNLKAGDCIVAFKRKDLFRLKNKVERTTNKKWEEGSTKASSDHRPMREKDVFIRPASLTFCQSGCALPGLPPSCCALSC